MQSIGSVMVFGMNQILISFTTTATAVFGAYFKLQSFIFMPVFGLNNGMVPIIAYNYGAKKPDRVKRTIKLAVLSAMAIMAVGFAMFEIAPGALLSFFDASENMLAIGAPALRIIALSFILAGFCIIAGSVCQAIGNPFYSLIVSVCRQLVVLLPVAWLLSQTGNLDPGVAGLPHRRAHVLDPEYHFPAKNPPHGGCRHGLRQSRGLTDGTGRRCSPSDGKAPLLAPYQGTVSKWSCKDPRRLEPATWFPARPRAGARLSLEESRRKEHQGGERFSPPWTHLSLVCDQREVFSMFRDWPAALHPTPVTARPPAGRAGKRGFADGKGRPCTQPFLVEAEKGGSRLSPRRRFFFCSVGRVDRPLISHLR